MKLNFKKMCVLTILLFCSITNATDTVLADVKKNSDQKTDKVKTIKSKKSPTIFNINLMTEGDEFSFDTKAIEAPIGKKIKLKYSNKMNQKDVYHNIAIVKLSKEKQLFKNLNDVDYDLKKIDRSIILAMTKELSYDESDTIEFTPNEEGVYVYVCLMQGHGNMMGMRGELKIVNEIKK